MDTVVKSRESSHLLDDSASHRVRGTPVCCLTDDGQSGSKIVHWRNQAIDTAVFPGKKKRRSPKRASYPTRGWLTPNLFGGNQRVCDCVDGEGNAVLDADFAHQLGDVGLHCAFFNSQS
jgi:hypothetical protein